MANKATWTKRVEEWRASGRTARAFCEGRVYSLQSLRYWSSRLKRAAAARAEPVRLARVAIVPNSRSTRIVDGTPVSESPIVVELGAVRICVRAGFDPSTLAAVVDAMQSRAGDQ